MGRRALPKIDPELDINGIFFMSDDLPEAFDQEAMFGRIAPLEVEVGSGKGMFLQSTAPDNPSHDFIGIEIAQKYARLIASRVKKHGITNVCSIGGDAEPLFATWFPSNHLHAVHVYFPDPWWKKRHRKRRVLNEKFLRNVQRVLRPTGQLHFWTDVQEYFETSLELIAEVTTLAGPLPVKERDPEHDMDYHTHFERRKRKDGLPIYRSVFEKKAE